MGCWKSTALGSDHRTIHGSGSVLNAVPDVFLVRGVELFSHNGRAWFYFNDKNDFWGIVSRISAEQLNHLPLGNSYHMKHTQWPVIVYLHVSGCSKQRINLFFRAVINKYPNKQANTNS
jgi:hypothetical protein